MVSQMGGRPAGSSRERLLAAATVEFAARGFDGAKVDRIAARARVNKAMLYYHFTSKAALYRQILRDLFNEMAGTIAAVRQAGGPPEVQLRRFIETVAAQAATRPQFPALWLREIAEGGRHLDDSVVTEIARIMQALAAILDEGRRAGVFRDVHPFLTQVGIVGPLLFFAATAPVRERFSHRIPYPLTAVPGDAIIEYVQAMTLAALARDGKPAGRRPLSTRRSRS
jgi:TetR/AcrR family transcriptional regulator